MGDKKDRGGRLEGRENLRKREKKEGRRGRPVGDPTPQRGKVMAYTQARHPKTQASTRTPTSKSRRQKKNLRKIKLVLCGLYKNQHMLAGSACTVLPIIISVVILTTDRELDQDTCREGVDTAEAEKMPL